MPDSRERLITNLVQHGATQVELDDLARESDVVWRIAPNDEVSEPCVRLEEFICSATRNAQSALRVIDRMVGPDKVQDLDLLTALKKYVEDTCEAIKVVDNTLKENGTNLESLFFEVPQDASDEEMSWRNLIGRRDVIAHRLLTVDDNQVYREAVRDFGSLHKLLSRIHFNPVKTDLMSGKGPEFPFKGDLLRNLAPSKYGQSPSIGESLTFVSEDRLEGLFALRLGRTEDNKMLIGASLAPRTFHISIYTAKRASNP